MKQKSLFDTKVSHDGEESFSVPPSRTHRSHGSTSRMAAFKLDLSNKKHRTMVAVRAIVNTYGKSGLTAYEIDELAVRLYGLKEEEARKRCSDCGAAGLIRANEDVKKRCPIRGSICKTWWPMEATK